MTPNMTGEELGCFVYWDLYYFVDFEVILVIVEMIVLDVWEIVVYVRMIVIVFKIVVLISGDLSQSL